MSKVAERVVALAADQLPEPERSRRSEEWSADLEGANEQGLSGLGIAVGALAFAIKAPVASPVAADWWARWALMFATIGPVVWLSLRASGLFMSNPPLRDAILPFVDATTIVAIALVIVAGLRSRGMPWVASGTVIVLCLSALFWIGGTAFFPLRAAALALAVAGLVVVGIRLRRAEGSARAHVVAALGLATLPLVAVAWEFAGWFGWWVPLAAAGVAAAVAIVILGRTPHVAVRSADPRLRAALIAVIAVTGVVVALGIAVIVALTMWQHDAAGARLWAELTPMVTAQAIGYMTVGLATLAVFLRLTAVARRRRPSAAVSGLGFVLAAALVGAGSTLPYQAPWSYDLAGPLGWALAFIGCVLAVVGVILLIAPLEARSSQPVAA